MIGYSAILSRLATTLGDNAGISAFLATNDYSALSVFIGEDAANPLGETEVPYVVIMPALSGSDMAECKETVDIGIECDFGLIEKGSTKVGNITSFDGIAKGDAFAKLVYVAIASALEEFEHITKADYQLTVERLPLIEGGISFTIETEQGISDL